MNFKNKKNLSLALMLVGGLLCILPLLMTEALSEDGLR